MSGGWPPSKAARSTRRRRSSPPRRPRSCTAAPGEAAATARQTFEEGTLAASLPTVEVPRAELEKGIGVLTAFADKAKLVASNGEARRQIKAGGLRVNDAAVTDEKMTLTPR